MNGRVGLMDGGAGFGAALGAMLEQHGLTVVPLASLGLIAQSKVDAAAVFLERLADARPFLESVRHADRPVAVLCASGEPLHAAAVRQAGAVLARDSQHLADAAAALAVYGQGPLPAGNRVAIAGSDGGAAALALGACRQAGLEAELAAGGHVPSTAQGVIQVGAADATGTLLGRPAHIPAVAWSPTTGAGQLPSFPTPERAVWAYRALVDWAAGRRRAGRAPETAAVQPMNIEGSGIMDEHEAKRLLDRWGVPVVPETLVTGPGRHEFTPIRKLATHFGFPVVLKAIHRDIVHKSEMNAVAIGLAGIDQLKVAWEAMHGRFPEAAWLIQPYLPGDVEVIVGARRDPVFGPVVTFGPGGVMTDLYQDVSLRLAPLTRDDGLEMVAETKAADLLAGYRGLPVHDPAEVADVLVKVGQLMLGQPSVRELTIGPLLITEKGPVAVDAMAVIG